MTTDLPSSGPSREEVRRRLAEVLGEVAHIPAENIHDDATINDDLRLESIAFVQMQVAIEQEYDIEIDPIEVVELNRFGDIVDYICSLVTAAR